MRKFLPGRPGHYDLHHALFHRSDVQGLPVETQRMIHTPLNLIWVPHKDHASHSNIPSRAAAYKILCQRHGEAAVEAYVTDMLGRFKKPPFTVESLRSGDYDGEKQV